VNIFNVLYIDQLAHWISVQGFDFVYWNIMHDAPYFSIASLPDHAKQAIAEHLNSVVTGYKKDFAGIVDFMMGGISTDGAETCQQIQKLDQRREQNLADVAPELARLLNYVKA
jgi:galactose-1-phosphate uridylyltransferase